MKNEETNPLQIYHNCRSFFHSCFSPVNRGKKYPVYFIGSWVVHPSDFSNRISENDSVNIIDNEYVYNGGGVAIGDFNNDGLQDVYFTGNMVSNKLYLNKGSMHFRMLLMQAALPVKVAGVPELRWLISIMIVGLISMFAPHLKAIRQQEQTCFM